MQGEAAKRTGKFWGSSSQLVMTGASALLGVDTLWLSLSELASSAAASTLFDGALALASEVLQLSWLGSWTAEQLSAVVTVLGVDVLVLGPAMTVLGAAMLVLGAAVTVL